MFFFFKHKTAYEMRISNWSSDVCSSDLQRWQVELFFKWIKQHLRIKAFFGTSANAVTTQVWIAVSVYVLIVIVRKRCGSRASLYEWRQILSVPLFEPTTLAELFAAPPRLHSDEGAAKHLIHFGA